MVEKGLSRENLGQIGVDKKDNYTCVDEEGDESGVGDLAKLFALRVKAYPPHGFDGNHADD